MDAIALLFAVTMTWFPYAFLAWYSGRPETPPADTARLRSLLLWTLGASAIIGAGWFVLEDGGGGGDLAFWAGGMGAFHALWWPLVSPALEPGTPPRADAVRRSPPRRRVASLRERRAGTYLPRLWWILPSAVFVGGCAYVAATFSVAPEGPLRWQAVIWPLGAFLFLAGYGAWAHFASFESQDLSTAPDAAALEEALDSLRRFLVRGIYGIATLAVAVFMAIACLSVTPGLDDATREGWVTWIGAGGGSLVGVAGGAFGTIAGFKRARAERLRGKGLAPTGS